MHVDRKYGSSWVLTSFFRGLINADLPRGLVFILKILLLPRQFPVESSNIIGSISRLSRGELDNLPAL